VKPGAGERSTTDSTVRVLLDSKIEALPVMPFIGSTATGDFRSTIFEISKTTRE
jgi:hypothetical protein